MAELIVFLFQFDQNLSPLYVPFGTFSVFKIVTHLTATLPFGSLFLYQLLSSIPNLHITVKIKIPQNERRGDVVKSFESRPKILELSNNLNACYGLY